MSSDVIFDRVYLINFYIQGVNVQVKNRSGEWVDVPPYKEPSDVMRLSRDKYEFRLKTETNEFKYTEEDMEKAFQAGLSFNTNVNSKPSNQNYHWFDYINDDYNDGDYLNGNFYY